MSGDVQARRRKDKRRKKEGGSLGAIHDPVTSHKFSKNEEEHKVFDLPDKGEKIHVQNEHGIGGNICVKIIFFCLFGLLIGAVALIYLQSQGSTDVDLPTIEESRFAEYFTGWLDDNVDDHHDEPVKEGLDHDEEQDEHDEHEDHDEHDEHESSEQGSLFDSLFGHIDEPDHVEESEEVVEKVTEVKYSEPLENVDENEESEENEKDGDDEEDDEDGDKNFRYRSKRRIMVKNKRSFKYNDDEEDEDVDESRNDEDDDEDEDVRYIKKYYSDKKKIMVEKYQNAKKDDVDDDDEEEVNENDDENDENDDEDDKDNDDDDKEDNDDDNKDDEDDEEEEEEDLSQVDEEDTSQMQEVEEEIQPKESKYLNELKKDITASEEEEEEKDEEEDDEDDKDDKDDKDEADESNEIDDKKSEEITKAISDELSIEEVIISEEDIEKPTEEDEKTEQAPETPEEANPEEEAEESGGVALKLGVGIALIIVAHLVLVKKWSKTEADEPQPEENKKTESTDSSAEPATFRRQTLVPETTCFDEESDVEEEEDEYENENDEVEEEIFTKSDKDSWQTLEKPVVNNVDNVVNEKEEEEEEEEEVEEEDEEDVEDEEEVDEEEVEDEEVEDEQEVEEDDEEVEEEEEELEEEDDIVDIEDEPEEEEEEEEEEEDNFDRIKDIVKQKGPSIVIKEPEEPPTPPPRTRGGRGGQDFDEEFIIQYEEETNTINDSPSEKPPENKVGNEDEWAFDQELNFAEEQLQNNPKAAVKRFEGVLSKKPNLLRALIGRAKALDELAEKEKSNVYLKQAIEAYKSVILNHEYRLNDDTYVTLAERCIERMRFAGALVSAIQIHKALVLKYPNTPKYRNTLAVTYLMLNKIPQAKVLLNETLSLWPDDGFALVHYGFILKTSENDLEGGAEKLMAGIKTGHKGVVDGNFFFHLGDALNRLGRTKEAMEWYELGVEKGLFLSKYQRSLYNVNRLKGQPWWSKEETTYKEFFRKLEENWREIRREGLELLNAKGVNLFKEEAENLKDTGDWKQLDLYFRGRKQGNCNKAPITCSLVSSFKPASTCTRGQIKFSVMLPKTHVWPHCGPTNCRLRSHLGLVVPKNTYIRVAEETRSWEEGKFIIFDDSFEHEVWHNGTGLRLVLIIDVWHPELTPDERRTLSPI